MIRNAGSTKRCLPFLLAFGLLFLFASPAQAGTFKGDWIENGTLITAGKNVIGETEFEGSLLIPAKNIELKCPAFEIIEARMLPLEKESKGSPGHGKVFFLSCKLWSTLPLLLSKNCTLNSPGEEPGSIFGEAKFRVVTAASGKPYVLMEPAEGAGSVFAEVEFGELCPVLAGETIQVKGSLVVQLSKTGEATTHLVESVPAEIKKEFGAELFFGVNTTVADGSGLVSMESGNKWGIE